MTTWRAGDEPRVVFATAPWCSNCRAMRPAVEEIVAASGSTLVEVAVEESPDAVDELGVRSVPTLVAFHDGEEVARLVGAQDRGAVLGLVEAAERGAAGAAPVRSRPPGELILLRAVVSVVLIVVGIVIGTPILAVIGTGIGVWLAGDLLPR